MPTRTIRVTAATFALQDRPTTEYATTARDRLPVQSAESEVFLRAVVDVPAGEVLLSATLELNLKELFGTTATVSVQRVNAPATYTGLNWNNRPANASGSSAVSVTQSGASTTLWQWNVTPDVAGRRVIDWRVSTTSATRRYFRGTRAAAGWPKLVVTTGAASTPPSGLTPDGGAVSLAAPTFQWDAREDATGFRLQIDEAGGDFSTPLKDTGNVTSGDAAYTLAGFSLVAATAYDWRVAHVLSSGLSEWSDPASINRATKPTLTITSPGGTTADPTPTVGWTFAGQEKWQVYAKLNGETIANSGERPGTDVAWQPPKGAHQPGDAVTYFVRTWDSVDRVGSPGDPEFVEASITSAFTPTGTVAGVTTVSATQVADTPAVTISYTRSAGIPDEVIITIDGVIVERRAGADGAWICWTAAPNVDHTYSVRAVTGGQASNTIVSGTFRTKVTGAWLVDLEDDNWFSFSGDQLSLGYGSAVQTFTPISAAKEIRRTSSLRGAEGELGGHITQVGGKTVAAQVADLWAMRSTPHRVFRLIVGDLNIPVHATDLWAAFDPETSLARRIEKTGRFTFGQTDDELPFEPI